MVESLIGLTITVIIVGIVALIAIKLLDMLPMEGGFKDVARLLIILVAVLVVILRALPLIGVSL